MPNLAVCTQGRDSTRKIQRAIIAQEQRKQLPGLMESLATALADYRTDSGRPFLYDGEDFQVTPQAHCWEGGQRRDKRIEGGGVGASCSLKGTWVSPWALPESDSHCPFCLEACEWTHGPKGGCFASRRQLPFTPLPSRIQFDHHSRRHFHQPHPLLPDMLALLKALEVTRSLSAPRMLAG